MPQKILRTAHSQKKLKCLSNAFDLWCKSSPKIEQDLQWVFLIVENSIDYTAILGVCMHVVFEFFVWIFMEFKA